MESCCVSVKKNTHLHTLTVVEEHIAELFGHHVQVSLLAFMGPGQNVELREVGRHIIERSRRKTENQKQNVFLLENHFHRYFTEKYLLYSGEDRVIFSKEHKGVFFITKQPHLLRGGWP